MENKSIVEQLKFAQQVQNPLFNDLVITQISFQSDANKRVFPLNEIISVNSSCLPRQTNCAFKSAQIAFRFFFVAHSKQIRIIKMIKQARKTLRPWRNRRNQTKSKKRKKLWIMRMEEPFKLIGEADLRCKLFPATCTVLARPDFYFAEFK